MRCAGNGLQLGLQRQWRAFERGKNVGKTGVGVIEIA